MKSVAAALLSLLLLPLCVASAEDITTINGKKYENATISRTEPDGIVVTHAAGISKVPFTDLSEDLRAKYQYDPSTAKKYADSLAAQQAALAAKTADETAKALAKRQKEFEQTNAANATRKIDASAAKAVSELVVYAVVEPFRFDERSTTVWVYEYVKYQTGHMLQSGLNQIPEVAWTRSDKPHYMGVIDEPMPPGVEKGDSAPIVLYKIGYTADSSRDPLFTMLPKKAAEWVKAGRPALPVP